MEDASNGQSKSIWKRLKFKLNALKQSPQNYFVICHVPKQGNGRHVLCMIRIIPTQAWLCTPVIYQLWGDLGMRMIDVPITVGVSCQNPESTRDRIYPLSSPLPPHTPRVTMYRGWSRSKIILKENSLEKWEKQYFSTLFSSVLDARRNGIDSFICWGVGGGKGPKDDPIPQKTHWVTCCSGNSTRTSRSQRRSWTQSSPNNRVHPHHSKRVAGFCFQALLMFDKLYRLEAPELKGLEAYSKMLNSDLGLLRLWFPIFQVNGWTKPGWILLPVTRCHSSKKTRTNEKKTRRQVWLQRLQCHHNFIFWGEKKEKKRMAKRRNSIHLLSCAPGEPPRVPLYGHRGAHRQLPHGPPTPFLFHPPTLPLNKSFPFQRNGSIVTLTHAQEIKRRYRSNLCAPLAAVRCRMCLPAHTHGKHSHTFAPGWDSWTLFHYFLPPEVKNFIEVEVCTRLGKSHRTVHPWSITTLSFLNAEGANQLQLVSSGLITLLLLPPKKKSQEKNNSQPALILIDSYSIQWGHACLIIISLIIDGKSTSSDVAMLIIISFV